MTTTQYSSFFLVMPGSSGLSFIQNGNSFCLSSGLPKSGRQDGVGPQEIYREKTWEGKGLGSWRRLGEHQAVM